MKHPDYWKLKAAFLEAQKARSDAELLVTRAETKLAFVMRMADLDPQQQYELRDDDESINVRESAKGLTHADNPS